MEEPKIIKEPEDLNNINNKIGVSSYTKLIVENGLTSFSGVYRTFRKSFIH